MRRFVLAWVAMMGITSSVSIPARARDALLLESHLSTGPHPPRGAPDVIVHVPAHYDRKRPLDVVVFLHGFDGCTRALVASAPAPCRPGEQPRRPFHLAEQHARAGTNSILIVPQLAYLARNSREHRFAEHGGFDRMLDELFAGPLGHKLGQRSLADVRTMTLVAHSGGYGATLSILSDPTRRAAVDHLVLLDAAYAGWDVFAGWALERPTHRLVSLHTQQKQTVLGNEQLANLLAQRKPARSLDGPLDDAVREHPVLIAKVPTRHGDFPERHLADVVRALCEPTERRGAHAGTHHGTVSAPAP